MKLNVNDYFMWVMSQKGAGGSCTYYVYKNIFLTFLLNCLFGTIIIV